MFSAGTEIKGESGVVPWQLKSKVPGKRGQKRRKTYVKKKKELNNCGRIQ
jgi:hypothetical protein